MPLRRARLRLSAIAALAGVMLLSACETAPVTGRRQLILLPESQAMQMGVNAYQQIKSETPVSNNAQINQAVQRAGRRIADVSGQPGLDWEFTVFDDPTPNAFALPGGKVGVHTGLFQVVKNEHQLAAVMAHEVAHVLARHSAERVSQQVLAQTGAQVVGATVGAEFMQLAAQAATLGVILPYSRAQESEADEIGLTYMARAGYDPRAAVEVWQNFKSLGGQRQPEFLSTHPTPDTRIQQLQAKLPEAVAIYESNPNKLQ